MTDTAPTAPEPVAEPELESDDLLDAKVSDLIPYFLPESRLHVEVACQQMRGARLQAEVNRLRQHILSLSSALLAAGVDPVTLQPTASKPEPGPERNGAEVAKDKSAAT